jgi:hypothetical protein
MAPVKVSKWASWDLVNSLVCGAPRLVLATIASAVRVDDFTHKEQGWKVNILPKERRVHRKLFDHVDVG